ncbi:MAG: hypothetical protein PVG87_19680, partial [Desulfobacteraceae bacterium]
IGFNTGFLIEAVSPHLTRKRHLGIHTPFFTDALMDLVQSGAVTNYRKCRSVQQNRFPCGQGQHRSGPG